MFRGDSVSYLAKVRGIGGERRRQFGPQASQEGPHFTRLLESIPNLLMAVPPNEARYLACGGAMFSSRW